MILNKLEFRKYIALRKIRINNSNQEHSRTIQEITRKTFKSLSTLNIHLTTTNENNKHFNKRG